MNDSAEGSTDAGSPEPADHKKHLRPPWVPGQSGNPSGKRRGSHSIFAAMKRMLAEDPDPVTGEGRMATYMAKLALDTMVAAMETRDPKLLASLSPLLGAVELFERTRKQGENATHDRIMLNLTGMPCSTWTNLEDFMRTHRAKMNERVVEAQVVPHANGNGNGNGHG